MEKLRVGSRLRIDDDASEYNMAVMMIDALTDDIAIFSFQWDNRLVIEEMETDTLKKMIDIGKIKIVQ